MTFSFFDLLLLIGMTQGVIASLLLLFTRDENPSHVFLALAILSFCLLFLKIIMNYNGMLSMLSFRYFPNSFELATAPLFYFYLLALTDNGFKWRMRNLIHFLPFALAQGYALLLFFVVHDLPTIHAKDSIASELHYVLIKEVEDWLIVISIFSYLFFGYRKYIQFHKQVKDNTADSAYPTLSWLRNILMLSALLVVWLLINMTISRLNLLEADTEIHWKLYFIYQAAVTYYLSFMAYRQQKPDLQQIYPSEDHRKNNGVSAETAKSLAQELLLLLEHEKIYLEPGLNIRQVAKKLSVSPSIMSKVINEQLNKSFRELINEYRIEDIKVKLIEPENTASILSLALESGFNSEASFYRVFKNNTGQTPKAFIKSQR
ncbi:helix-turn-helix transcriptional regulator [Marinicella sp. S1101]|uniref:helix-turn-helix transcriptional regulator n=1 Tax=Marinicella marina TaxID=2996016 RepID=UPI002260FBBA|nr:helix-turn-helix transcriptional regulator [Marinicella marina]MCX7552346.1 helix-turn-helix transcriptional regulator [Marinicella marina]MDJ1139221.1 helix-turn-helix transcriptional regulator [Marinicella marina]